MTVLIYEPNAAGHRFHYVSLLAAGLQEIGVRPLLATTRGALQSDHFATHLSEICHQKCPSGKDVSLEVFEVDKRASQFDLGEGKRFSEAIKSVCPEHLFVPTASQFTAALGKYFLLRKSFGKPGMGAEGIHTGPGYAYPVSLSQKLKNRSCMEIERRLPWTKYGHIDPFQLNAIRGRFGSSSKYQVTPDPAPTPPKLTKQQVRSHFGIPEDGSYLGCMATISVSKGILELLAAFSRAQKRMEDTDRLLLLGKFEPELFKLIQNRYPTLLEEQRIICIDRHLSEYDMNIAALAFDFVCAAHRIARPGSSGVILRAAAAGIPVLTGDQFWQGTIVPRFKLGWTCKVLDEEDFANALISSLSDCRKYRPSETSERFAKFHSEENFKAHWTELIRRKLGIGPAPQKLTWEWVLDNQPLELNRENY